MNEVNYCGLGKSKATWLRPPYWYFHNASCKIHDENYEQGGSRMDRMTADIGFFRRMLEDANKLPTLTEKRKAVYSAIIYFLIVRVVGWLSFFVINWFKKILGIKKNNEL